MSKICILGAGYGGLLTAVTLEKEGQPFTLINKHDYHYFTTLLHEPAGGRNEFDSYYVDLHKVLRKDSSHIQKALVTELRPQDNKVVTDQGEVDYDYLVFALGNAPEYFGIPGMQEHALVLRSLETAKELNDHIERVVASYKEDGDETKLRIVVGGAGLTGIELCGELAEWLPELAAEHGIPAEKMQLINLEAAPTILPMLDEELREKAESVLRKKGVDLRTNTMITKVNENQVELKTGDAIDAKTIIWTGGVRANPLIADAGFEVDRKGRAKVNEYLQSVDYDNVFVIGDSAWFEDDEGKPLPPTAQAASQMGEAAAENVLNLLHSRSLKKFEFNYMGTLASLGSEIGVGEVKGLKTAGVSAGLMKEASKIKHLFNIGGFRMVALKRGQLKRKG
ncbi:MAG TPA: NAD(P)/FAD-dependent oxidoreductase [Bacilli bacterium]|nr:NAD(P)/FAD-dependent oxidoreductase [Bacilli bacterium]